MNTLRAIFAVLLIALPGCRKAANGSRSEGPAIKVLSSITFQVDDPESKADGPSPYVHLADPQRDLSRMRGAEDIVLPATELTVILDYPLAREFSFPIKSSSPAGFTRAELARKIAELYQRVYEEEAQTSKVAVIPLKERKGLINRNTTNGKYGIWGHDLEDLDLLTIEIVRSADGILFAHLDVDS